MNNELLLETSVDIMKALQKRRKNGGCSAWRDIGLKWVSDNDRYDILKYDWEWDYIKNNYKSLNEEDKPKKLKLDIPENPFEETDDVDDEIYSSDNDVDDIREVNGEVIENELDRLKWKTKNQDLYDYFNMNSQNIEKGFYCYVVSQLGRENLSGYMEGFRSMIKGSIVKKEEKELPKVIKKDEVTMDFRKKKIDDYAHQLSNQVMEDLFLLINNNDKVEESKIST